MIAPTEHPPKKKKKKKKEKKISAGQNSHCEQDLQNNSSGNSPGSTDELHAVRDQQTNCMQLRKAGKRGGWQGNE